MSKCHFIVIKKKPTNKPPQTKSTPDQNTPESTNCCKQTQMQEQSFSVAVVADGSHCGISPPGGGWREWAPSWAGAAGRVRDVDVEPQTWGAAALRKADLSGVPMFSLTQEDKSPFSAPGADRRNKSLSLEFLKYSPKTEKFFCLPRGSGIGFSQSVSWGGCPSAWHVAVE